LEARARKLGVGARELALAAVNDLVGRQDDGSERAAQAVREDGESEVISTWRNANAARNPPDG
jgi:hypothetical protein